LVDVLGNDMNRTFGGLRLKLRELGGGHPWRYVLQIALLYSIVLLLYWVQFGIAASMGFCLYMTAGYVLFARFCRALEERPHRLKVLSLMLGAYGGGLGVLVALIRFLETGRLAGGLPGMLTGVAWLVALSVVGGYLGWWLVTRHTDRLLRLFGGPPANNTPP
jgi:hypothetical protein